MSISNNEILEKIKNCEGSSKRVNSLMYNAGFKYIGINEKIKDFNNNEIGEIDGIWQYDNITFLIEATSQRQDLSQKKTLFFTKWAHRDNLNAIIQQFSLSQRAEFVRIFVDLAHNRTQQSNVATRHLDNTEGNIVLYKDDIEYFENQESLIKKYCKYDILSFMNIKRTDHLKKTKAIKIKIGNYEAFVFSLPVKTILEICYVSRRIKGYGYQRMLDESKIRRIKEEIFEQRSITFPNAIIVTPSNGKIKSDLCSCNSSNTTPQLVDLYLPDRYCSFRIVDGQHRLLGFTLLNELNIDKYDLPIVALNDIGIEDEVQTFIRINSTQKRMDPSLILNLKADFDYERDHPFYRDKIAVEIARKLNKDSPLKNKIFFGTVSEIRENRTVTLTTLVNQLKNTVINKKYPLFGENIDNIDELYLKLKDLLIKLIGLNKKAFKVLHDNRGIRVLFKLLKIIKINKIKQTTSKDIEDFICDFANILDEDTIKMIYESYGEGGARIATEKIIEKLRKKDSAYKNIKVSIR